MADEKRDTPRPFDVKTVEYLLKLMSAHDLAEVHLREGDQQIRLRRGAAIPAGLVAAPVTAAPQPVAQPAPHSAQIPATPAAPTRNLIEIKSPMVGTYYSKPKPSLPDYVSVGSSVKPDTVICLIEAMKLYNDIKAEVSGKIAEVCVNNGDFVEFNQVLFRVEPA